MKKHWSILKINEKLAKTFERDAIISIISFKRSRKLREIIDGNTIINRNIKKKRRKYERKMSSMQPQEKHNMLQTSQDHYIFHKLQKRKDF